MNKKTILILAFICGAGSSLFISTPFGRIAMFDLVSYVFGPILYFYWFRTFTKVENRLFLLAVLWFLGTCYSNWWREESFDVALKGDSIVFNVICMLIVAVVLIKRSFSSFLWFSSGYGIGCVMSLYVFQNGSYLSFAESAGYMGQGWMQEFLVEKQIYPMYAQAIFLSVLFPLRCLGLVPWGMVSAGCVAISLLLLFKGGSRSAFGSYFLTAIVVIGYAYLRPLVRAVLKNAGLFSVVMATLVVVTYSLYAHLADSGALGDKEYEKYITGIEESKAGALGDRDDLFRAWPFLRNHPFIGCGSSARDRWGYIEDNDLIPSHSALVAAWTQNGILGLTFWIYSIILIANFTRGKAILFGDWFPFLAFQMVFMMWNILFSPFGWYRGYACMALALCAVSNSKKAMEQIPADVRIKVRRLG